MSSILGGGGSDLDAVLKAGNTSVEHMRADGANTNANAVTEDRTIASGDTHVHGNIDIGAGRSWTVSAGGTLIGVGNLTVSGTGVLIVNGTALATN